MVWFRQDAETLYNNLAILSGTDPVRGLTQSVDWPNPWTDPVRGAFNIVALSFFPFFVVVILLWESFKA